MKQTLRAAPKAGPGGLANVFVPNSHHRYASLVEWAKDADERFWRFGQSSDGRSGIWVSWDKWESAPSTIKKTSDYLDAAKRRIRKEYHESNMEPPHELALSMTARRDMAQRDKDKYEEFPE